MSDRGRGLFAREREGPPFGGATGGAGRGVVGMVNAGRTGVVADSGGDGKEDTLVLVGLGWKRVAIFIGRLRVGVELPAIGVNFASLADA